MNITEKTQNDIVIFAVDGRIDSEGAVDLDMALHAALEGGHNKLILDMKDAQYINSAGLRTLADVLTTSQAADGNLYLVGLNPKIKRVLQIVGFDNFFKMYDDVASASAAF